MVLNYLVTLLSDRYGCNEEDIEMAATLDDLNLTADDLDEIALFLGEIYGVDIPTAALRAFETIEDIVGYLEDRL